MTRVNNWLTPAGAIFIILAVSGILVYKTIDGISWGFGEYFSLILIVFIFGFIIYYGIKHQRKQVKLE